MACENPPDYVKISPLSLEERCLTMGKTSVQTDAALQSILEYGTSEFPFAYYRDDLSRQYNPCVEWHWHNKFEFSYVIQGTVVCHIAGTQKMLNAGDGLFINSGMIHRFETESQGILANFIFNPEFLAETSSAVYRQYVFPLLSSSVSHIALCGEESKHSGLLEQLHRLKSICHEEVFGKELLIHNILSEIWYLFIQQNAELLKRDSDRREGLSTERLQRMMVFVHANYHNKLSLDEISAAANISKSEALRCFRHGIQTTPVQYLNAYRIKRAQEALVSSSDPVSEISASVGFESVGYFCQAFKKSIGCSPNEFRKRGSGLTAN